MKKISIISQLFLTSLILCGCSINISISSSDDLEHQNHKKGVKTFDDFGKSHPATYEKEKVIWKSDQIDGLSVAVTNRGYLFED